MKIRYIRNYLNGNTVNTGSHWVEIEAFDSNNTNIALGKSVTASFTNSNLKYVTNGDKASASWVGADHSQYVQVDLGDVVDIKSIKMYHYYGDTRQYKDNILQVSNDGKKFITLFNSAIDGEYTETSTGKEIILPSESSNIAKIYLYKDGNECTSITGGWTGRGVQATNSTSYTKKNAKTLEIACLNSSSATGTNYEFHTNKIVDLSKHNFLHTEFEVVNTTNKLYTVALGTTTNVTDKNFTYHTALTEGISYVSTGTFDDGFYKLTKSLTNKAVKGYVKTRLGMAQGSSKIFISKTWIETKENVITINSKQNNRIDFSCNNLDDLITVTKAEVYINNKLSKTYDNNFDNIIYEVDDSLCFIGENKLSIVATYTQGDDVYETASEVTSFHKTLLSLPETSSLKDVIDRYNVLNNSIELQKNRLKNILIEKGLEISDDENTLLDLVPRVNEVEVDDSKLYLYRNGVQCVELNVVKETVYGSNSNFSATFNTDHFVLAGTGANSVDTYLNVYTKNILDISKYKKLYIEYQVTQNTNTAGFHFLLGVDNDTSPSNGRICEASPVDTVGNKTTSSCDISNVTSGYPFAGLIINGTTGYSGTIKVYNLWLEK